MAFHNIYNVYKNSRTLLKPSSLKSFLSVKANANYVLPDLPYDYNALEPYISAEIMTLHHSKHHATYVKGLNSALEQFEEAQSKQEIEKMAALLQNIKFNGGGHINHSIFWKNLCPIKQFEPPKGDLAIAIDAHFGSLEKLIEKFTAKAIGVQGSGWAWLGYNKSNGKLELTSCPNQDPLITQGLEPLLGIDVWEHAYYLQYKNVRPDYLKAIWNIINWKDVSERFAKCKS